jgi:predicted DNA-binding protein (UPF0251 family)
MSGPEKLRFVAQLPNVGFLGSVGIPANALQGVHLSPEELESIPLKDLEGLERDEYAKQMRTARPNFHCILKMARKKLAGAMINGEAI